ncbi:MAG TPA: hypothetical protein LFW13_00010 [Rickettsia endosymbiont of Sericostoma sp.]|uniref:hypothetical protein n=1 Tax=unclassified Candidatus Tisiphia TaxID=2996318 RepID=UPI001DE2F8BE|nr:hypothetical protein [Rickettsia endosymbiont of Sericostoma sp. HW-2014]HJD63400.1 hypothetical protein [Rickettsia endosymbiont of Sericostoma sp.]
MATIIIYLIGKPGTGKYTIAKEIARAGYSICDNQHINNPIFSLLNYNGLTPIPEFAWDAIRLIRDGIFNFLSQEISNNYVLTNCLYEVDGDRKLFNQVQQLAINRSSVFIPVKLLISEEENIKRIQHLDRLLRYKSIGVQDVYPEYPLIQISHPNLFEFDVTNLSASEAARNILQHVKFYS